MTASRILIICAILLVAASARAQSPACTVGHLVTIEPDGSASRGSKDQLRRVVENAVPLRVGWSIDANADGVSDLSHWTDAGLVTVFEGEIFTQIADIQRQAPNRAQKRVLLPPGRQRWTGLLGTNGLLESHFDDGTEPTSTRVRSTWCVDPRTNPAVLKAIGRD